MRIESSIGFDLSAIEVFVAVCETKSMVKASQKLQLTESAVSHSIRSMEAKLGLDLFDRTFRPLKPTAMGLHLLERGRRLLSEASSISGDLKAMGQVAYSQLRVGVIESMSTWFASKLVQGLAASASNWVLTITSNDELWRRFEARELDIIVVIDDERYHGESAQIRLLRESAVLVTPPAMASRELEDIAMHEPLIGAHIDSGFGRMTARYLSRLKINRGPKCAMDTLDGVLMTVSHGYGWAILPSIALLRANYERHKVVVRRLPPPGLSRRILLVMREQEMAPIAELIVRNSSRILLDQLQETLLALPHFADTIKVEVEI